MARLLGHYMDERSTPFTLDGVDQQSVVVESGVLCARSLGGEEEIYIDLSNFRYMRVQPESEVTPQGTDT